MLDCDMRCVLDDGGGRLGFEHDEQSKDRSREEVGFSAWVYRGTQLAAAVRVPECCVEGARQSLEVLLDESGSAWIGRAELDRRVAEKAAPT